MIEKDLRNGKFLRLFDNDLVHVEMDVNFTNNEIIEPYFELGMDNGIGLSLADLNKNYNLKRGSFTNPLTNNQNPIKLSVEYTCVVGGEQVVHRSSSLTE